MTIPGINFPKEHCTWAPGANYQPCSGMARQLAAEPNTFGKGLSSVNLSSLEQDDLPECFVGVAYRKDAKDRGLFLNWCPWCGVKLQEALRNTHENGKRATLWEPKEPEPAPGPSAGPVFAFTSFDQWCDKAKSWFATCGVLPEKLLCVDARGRIVRGGSDFMRARDEGAFPVRAYHYRNLTATPSENPEFEGPTSEQQGAAVERELAKRMGGDE